VVFKDVTFSYIPEKKILDGVNFTMEKGKKVAIVGSSGVGKSTILRLLFRFFDTSSGQILLDGQDVKSITLDSLRRTIGVVPQVNLHLSPLILTPLKGFGFI